jgi:glucose/arabinose dehydrogenase
MRLRKRARKHIPLLALEEVAMAVLRRAALLMVVGVLTAATPSAVPTGFQNEIWIPGLHEPTSITFLPDGRMLVAERDGRISVAAAGSSQLLPQPMLTLTAIDTEGGERGLVGLAVHPQFATNPYVYAYYTSNSPLRDRVSRFTVTGNTASLASELVVWQDIVNAELYHHGGTVAFGPDGLLYVSTGDQFEPANSQSLTSYHGKILRIGADGVVPADNPFHDGAGPNLDAIWARGLRNAFRFSFDRLTGTMYVGDVGSNEPATSIEEVNVGVAGANFGWPICEGVCAVAGMTNPIHTYPHANRDASITGGFVYRGTVFPPAYQGSYFFGDYAQNWIRRLTLSAPGVVSGVVNFEPTNGAADGPYGEIVDLKEGPDGAVYYVDIGPFDGVDAGSIRRIRYTLGNAPPIVVASADPVVGPAPLTVAFSSAGSSDPEGASLTYAWDFGDGQASTEPNPSHVYPVNGAYTARLTVSDGQQQTLSTPLTIRVGRAPVVTLASPTNGATFRAGDIIQVAGTAQDPDEGSLPPASLSWTVVFHHEGHQHPFLGPITGGAGSFTAPSSGHEFSGNTRYEVIVTATDGDGLSTSASAFVWPQKVAVTIDTAPSGLELTVNGIVRRAPLVLDSLIGFQHAVAAASPQLLGGSLYTFASWSDGGAAAHTFTTPAAAAALTATFQAATQPITATFPAVNSLDDVNEVATVVEATATTVWIGNGASSSASYTGLRFPLTIPPGATISAARIEMNAAQTQWLSIGFEIGVEDSGSATLFSASARPSSRVLTAGRVSHVSNAQWVANTWYTIGEVSPLLQEVVRRPDWTANSAAAFVLRGTGAVWGRKFARSVEGASTQAPRLVVTFIPAAPPPSLSPSITAPAEGAQFSAGQTINFAGTASATLPDSTYAWTVVFHHDTHPHPAFGPISGPTGSFVVPTSGHDFSGNTWYELVLTVTDGQGVTATASRSIVPDKIDLTLMSDPPGLQVSLDAATQSAPLAKDTLIGFTHRLTTTSPQTLAGVTYEFTGWSDGGAIAHDITAPTVDTSLIASFRPVAALSVSSPTIAEGHDGLTNLNFTVTLAPASSSTVTATYTTANGSATAGSDYTAATGLVTFAPGVTTQLVSVAIVGDTDVEGNETFTLELANPTGGAVIGAAGVGTITNDDQAPVTIAIGDLAVLEGHAGTANVLVPVTLSMPAAGTVSAQYVIAAGTATAGSDFTAASGLVTFAAGQTAATISVTVAGDVSDEPDETITVDLSAPSGATLADSQSIVTITDDDAAPTVAVGDVSVSEGATTATVTLSLSAVSGRPVSVTATTSNLTASPADFSAVTQSVTFAVGAATATLAVPITTDVLDEANETFAVTLSAPANATIGDGSGVVTIIDDDPAPSLSIADVSVVEGNTGGSPAVFTVTLSAASGQTVTVAYATASGTATGGDFTAVSGALTFLPGATTQTISVSVLGDVAAESDETFTVTLSAPVNAAIGDGQAVGSIVNDDVAPPAPVLTIGNASITENNSGSRNLTFTVSLTPASATTVTVGYATAPQTATAEVDYTTRTGTLSFAAGVTSRSFTVPVIGDSLGELNETFVAVLSGATNATIGTGTGVATIVDNDAEVTVTLPSATVTWAVGSSQSITWSHNLGVGAAVRIELTRDNGTTWTTLADPVASAGATTGAFAWTVTGPATTAARIRVVWLANPAVVDQSNKTFRIQ